MQDSTRGGNPAVVRNMVLGFGAVAVLMALTAWFTIARTQRQLANTETFHEQAYGSLLQIDGLANDAAQELFAYVISDYPEELTEFRHGADLMAAEFSRYASLAHLSDVSREDGLRRFSVAQTTWTHFLAQAELLVAERDQDGTVSLQRFDALEHELDEFTQLIDAMLAGEAARVEESRLYTTDLLRQSNLMLVVVVGAGIFALLIIGVLLTRQIARHVAQLRRSDEDLRLRSAALESTQVGICYTSAAADNVMIFANAALCEMTGYTSAELIGQNCRLFQGGDTDGEELNEIRHALEAGQPVNTVLRNYRKSGEPFWNALFISPVRNSAGKLTHFVGAMHDVTERFDLTSQLARAQKMEAVGQLAGGIAHDFNNYLTVILGNAELLHSDLPSGALKTNAQQIMEAGERSATLTRHLLAFSKRQVLVPQVLDLNRVILDMDPLLRRTLGERVNLETTTAGGLGMVSADRSQIEQVLLNLVVNARDAMPGGGRITVETGNVYLDSEYASRVDTVTEGRYVMIAVSDTGSGIEKAVVQHIFEPFFTTKETGGGLGLSTVQGIVEQSGGSVQVYSEVGEGTTFKVYLPRIKGTVEANTPPINEVLVNLSGTVLVVEDEAMVRDITCQMLRGLGLEVMQAETGTDGLEMIRKHGSSLDLLLTDVMLPGLNGRQLADQAQALFPNLAVLYMSGYTENGIMHQGRLEDGIALLEKPFTIAELKRKLANLLNPV